MNRIAIIDDSEINLLLLNALVGKLGDCESVLFQESPKGLAWCTENEPDLIVVDYMMPEMDGIQFISRLRAKSGMEDVPVLMITANDDKDVRYEALQMGATDFLTKPVDRVEFSARIRNMLALGTSRKKLADKATWLAEEVKKATAAIHAREQDLLFRMSRAAEFRDPETGAHIQRMSHYSRLIAEQLGLSESDQQLILQAAPMHDIGKIGIPDAILLKPGKLTPEEFELMKSHAVIGHELLKGSESVVLQTAAVIALSHHEKFDGSGYPGGVSGESIPLFGRIAAVADVFDALTSERPYKKAWPLDRAAEMLRAGSGNHFDPACVSAFFASWDRVLEIHARFQDADVLLTNELLGVAMGSEALIYDRSEAIARLDGDAQLFADMARMFISETETNCTALEEALKSGDSTAVRREAHTVKSLFATFSCEVGRELAMRLEYLAATGSLDGADSLAVEVVKGIRGLSQVLSSDFGRQDAN